MTDSIITDGQARRIASEWHSGQWSALYSFASCGAIQSGLLTEVVRERESRLGAARRRDLLALEKYVRSTCPDDSTLDDGDDRPCERDPVGGWADLWDDTPPTAAQATLWEVVTLDTSPWRSRVAAVFGPALKDRAQRHLAIVQESLPPGQTVRMRTVM